MCSNTHMRRALAPGSPASSRARRSVSETISPGWTSRISCAPMMSKAQLSEATTKHSGCPSDAFIFPSASGRTPCGSRKATTACLVITTVE